VVKALWSKEWEMSSDSSLGEAVFTVLLGAALLSVGTAVALNWRGWATRYTDFTDDAFPPLRQRMATNRWRRLLIQNRIIFAVFAVFGLVLLIGGIAGLVS
jgi:hypothetical protein